MKRVVMLADVFMFMASPAMANNHEIKKKMPNLSVIGIGKMFYDENCASCHGASMKGADQGPAFLHRVYHPNHHGDAAFYIAVQRGVRRHHRRFGNMSALKGLRRGVISSIVKYIRFMQKQAGIF